MEFQKEFIITPYNYFAWKEKISIHIRTIGLYKLTLNTDTKPTLAIEKSKYLNRMDEALGTICSLISPDLLFHISSYKTPNEAWKILEGIFGKHDEMRGHMLEVELLTLDPKRLKISKIALQNSLIYCCKSKLAGLINQQRRNKWLSPFSPSLIINS